MWNAVFIFGLFFSKTTDSDFQKSAVASLVTELHVEQG